MSATKKSESKNYFVLYPMFLYLAMSKCVNPVTVCVFLLQYRPVRFSIGGPVEGRMMQIYGSGVVVVVVDYVIILMHLMEQQGTACRHTE